MDEQKQVTQEEITPPQARLIPLIALRGLVVYPRNEIEIDVSWDKSKRALRQAKLTDLEVFVVCQRDTEVARPEVRDLYTVGTVCTVTGISGTLSGTGAEDDDGVVKVRLSGQYRAEIVEYVESAPAFAVQVRRIDDESLSDKVRRMAVQEAIEESIARASGGMTETSLLRIPPTRHIARDPDGFCYAFAQKHLAKTEEGQSFLEILDQDVRLERTYAAILVVLDVSVLKRKIDVRVRKQMDKNSKEYFLREQVKAIHEELGDGEEELQEYLARADKLPLPEEVLLKVKREVRKLQRLSPPSPEAGVSRSYVEWVLDLPWGVTTADTTDMTLARRVLNDDHFGLEKVKERILEYLAVLRLTGTAKGPILCFVGPPGVGKTSIARSIARTLGRKFVSMSLGGVHDEAEIRGHRRTYIGAVPGRVLYHLKQSGTTNPVFLFDEIDKMGSGIHGDPASAMLEVLDPEQNKDFRDNYLELPFDLSKVLFLTTANSLDTVPAPLLDRMEVIELSGYTDYEKEQIALRYLVDKQARASGLGEKGITFSPDALQTLIHRYTRESGVRNLEREIASSMRKLALKEVDGRLQTPHEVTGEEVLALLGKPPFCDTEARLSDEVGVCNGLAWTSAGGKTLEIEVTLTPGKGEVLLTGRLGDVMKESAYAALTLVQSRGAQYGVDTARFETCDVHLHVPEGATPKDGPSAGVAIATAVMSAFSGRAVRHDVAMTGEVTLRGAVLPIGGLKEKLLAAYRAGITTVIIPQENEKDLDEIPADIRAVLTIVTATSVETVFSVALVQA